MKTRILIFISGCVMVYFLASFIQWNLNPYIWGHSNRTLCVVFMFLIGCLFLVMHIDSKKNK